MPRLVNLGVGEIVDRLTILALKLLYAAEQGKPVEHFSTERNALLVMLRGRELNGMWFEHTIGLGAVNGALWRTEDAIREWREKWKERGPDSSGLSGGPGDGYKAATWPTIVAVAFRVQELNDQRAALIETINKLTGDHLGSEKLT